MITRNFRVWLNTIFILFLFFQGNYGKSLLGHLVGDGGEPSTIGNNSKGLSGVLVSNGEEPSTISKTLSEGNYSSLREALWYGRMKESWFRRPTKNPPFIDSHHGDDIWKHNPLDDKTPIKVLEGFLGDTWNDRMKTILVSITSLIPPIEGIPVGKIISALLKAFWPTSKKDIWSLMLKEVDGLIDKKILEFELQERNNEIHALQKTMQMYVEAQMREKGSLMSSMIHASNELFYKLTESKNSVQLIPLVVTHSTQHLLILKERLLHGMKMYDEDNTAVWRKDLEDQISSYKDCMKDIYSKWVEWRNSRITIKLGSGRRFIPIPPFFTYEPHGSVYDEMTGDTGNYRYSGVVGPNNKNLFKPICEALKKNMFGFRNGELLQIMVTTFYLDNFIPGNENNPSVIPPSMSIASFGPISPNIGWGNENSHAWTPGDDNNMGGDVTSINVREWNIIDGLQLIYSTNSGSFIGNSDGGKLHEIPLNNSRVKSIQLCENNCNMVELTIGFSNGKSTGRLGNRGGWHVGCVNTGGIDTYGLYNIRATGWGCAKGLFQIGLDFKAYPIRPSELDNRELHFVDLTQAKFQYLSVIDVEKIQ
ncbi:uncharacterized protein LOC142750294 isoform X1 [Rhinoderma darwinii]|uniref:uncharacterized protein LOC142750294 isoform X1 n=1 Tax=Rhinoderma darwinii TaxID=43563 RepID=UPI003F6707D9